MQGPPRLPGGFGGFQSPRVDSWRVLEGSRAPVGAPGEFEGLPGSSWRVPGGFQGRPRGFWRVPGEYLEDSRLPPEVPGELQGPTRLPGRFGGFESPHVNSRRVLESSSAPVGAPGEFEGLPGSSWKVPGGLQGRPRRSWRVPGEFLEGSRVPPRFPGEFEPPRAASWRVRRPLLSSKIMAARASSSYRL